MKVINEKITIVYSCRSEAGQQNSVLCPAVAEWMLIDWHYLFPELRCADNNSIGVHKRKYIREHPETKTH